MMSAYMSEFVSFNVLDKDYVEQKLLEDKKENADKEDTTKLEEIDRKLLS